ncbi:exocyst complex component EXO84C isoform X2 [Phalaenopsis equestris]|uniref:exocyst complex component EXO84C isoform X2 n=1 Tax=Phalaenopsis equestris TaxID=78828 RepID=UPI0009E3A8B3|nr:exocyst complex component EXO84C isoform X2 [Phalaenopsis equestris]
MPYTNRKPKRISEEVIEMEQELIELQKHVSVQGILVQDLLSGVFRELEIWNECQSEDATSKSDLQFSETDKILNYDVDDPKVTLLETMDILLAEHKIEDVLLVLHEEEKNNPELSNLGENQSNEVSSYRDAFLKRKEILKDLLVGVCEQPYVRAADLRKALSGLVTLGKVSLAHQLLLKVYGDHLQKKIEDFLPSCLGYTETFAATLSQFVFSTIFLAAKESVLLFGDMPVITNRIVQWAEYEIESFVRLVRENLPPSETYSALRSVSICVDAGLRHCSILETKGLKFSKLLMVLLRPQIEEILDMNFRRVRRKIAELVNNDEMEFSPLQPRPPTTIVASSNIMFISSGRSLMCQVEEMLGQLTPKFILYYGGTILNKLLQLFDKYVDVVIKALPGTSEDDNVIEHKGSVFFKAETDAEQLALLGTAFTVADELLPMAVNKFLSPQIGKREEVGGFTGSTTPVSISAVEYKDWRRHLQHSFDKLRDYFCRQYVLTFIYSREGKARMDARMYVEGKGDDLFWDSDALPSLPFQALFARLQQLVSVTRDVLHQRDKLQKNLLSRLTETVVMWLSEEQEFWDVFEDETIQLQPFGLQQLILDMHFIAEITGWGGYPSRNIHQLVSAIITRAIGIFSERGIDPQNALPEDEWFADTAKAAINKLLGPLASDSSEVEADEHLLLQDEISDAEKTPSSPSSTTESSESFASANMGETESSVFLSDPET